jgi:hypothetical protein
MFWEELKKSPAQLDARRRELMKLYRRSFSPKVIVDNIMNEEEDKRRRELKRKAKELFAVIRSKQK